MNAPKEYKYVTQGQAILAHGYAQDLCHHIYMASLSPEGSPAREDHVSSARKCTDEVVRLLGSKPNA